MKKRASVVMLVMAVGMLVACGQSKEAVSEAPAIPKVSEIPMVSQENTISNESISNESVSSEGISSESISSDSVSNEIEPIEVEYWDGSKKLVVDNTLTFATIQPYGDKVYSSLSYSGKAFDELPIFDKESNGTDPGALLHHEDDILGFCIQDDMLYYIENDRTHAPSDWRRARLYARPMEGKEADTILLAEDVSEEIEPVYQDGMISYKAYDTEEETDSKIGEPEQSSVGALIIQISATTGEVIRKNEIGVPFCKIYGISNDYIYYEDRDLNIFYKYDIKEGKKEVIQENSTNWEYYFDRGNLFAIDTTKEEENRYQFTQILELGEKIHRVFPREIEPVKSYRDMRYRNFKIAYRKGREFYIYDLETNQERVAAKMEESTENGYIEYIVEDSLYIVEYLPSVKDEENTDDTLFYQIDKDGKKTLINSWSSYDL